VWPFKSPDIEKLKVEGDIKGLVKALGHRKRSVRDAAAAALAEFGDAPEMQAILSEFRDNPDRVELQRRLKRTIDPASQYNRINGHFGGFR
jgi:HEAT repeat protein